MKKKQAYGASESLQPIIKWPGGKERELEYILPNMPKFKRYFEPFVGGGAVFTAMQAKEYYINDFSTELIDLYRNIASSNDVFSLYVDAIDKSWSNLGDFFERHHSLVELYQDYCKCLRRDKLKAEISLFCRNNKSEINSILEGKFQELPSVLIKEMESNLFRKMIRMRDLEIKKHVLPSGDVYDNIEAALRSALYMNFRYLYNNSAKFEDEILHCALFVFIRNYSYSGMFRYNTTGDFNVPYGGIAYNKKSIARKLEYYQSPELLNHFHNTHIYNLDFEDFLRSVQPDQDDFVFLDPPYDTEFCTYAKNEFTKFDQERLASLLLNWCPSKWMLIIKNTDFIYGLYNKKGINIRMFDKEYLVSFMNRNDKKVTHLLITNY